MIDRPYHPSELTEEHTLHYMDDEDKLAIEVVIKSTPGHPDEYEAYGYDEDGEERPCNAEFWIDQAMQDVKARHEDD